MQDKILKIAKRLKTFTLDDIVMFSDFEKNEINLILENSENIKQNRKYFEYIEKTVAVDKFKIVDKNITCKNSDISFVQACMEFLKTKENAVTFQTNKTYRTCINAQIIPFFAKFKLKEVTVSDVQNFKKFMQENKISERRIKNILTLLNQIIRHFQNEGYIEKTCIFEVKRLEKIPKREIPILTAEQLAKLFKIVQKDCPYMLPIIENEITEHKKLNDIIPNTPNKEYLKRKIRKDVYKIKEQLGLENYMIDDLRFTSVKNVQVDRKS